MPESTPIRQELVDKVEEIKSEHSEARSALRGLYRLYFHNKSDANLREKQFLLFSGFNFSLESELTYSEDKEIFAQEAQRYYLEKGPLSQE